jgi:hypothetical protein
MKYKTEIKGKGGRESNRTATPNRAIAPHRDDTPRTIRYPGKFIKGHRYFSAGSEYAWGTFIK